MNIANIVIALFGSMIMRDIMVYLLMKDVDDKIKIAKEI